MHLRLNVDLDSVVEAAGTPLILAFLPRPPGRKRQHVPCNGLLSGVLALSTGVGEFVTLECHGYDHFAQAVDVAPGTPDHFNVFAVVGGTRSAALADDRLALLEGKRKVP